MLIEKLQCIIEQDCPDPVTALEGGGWIAHYNYWPFLMDLLRTITVAPIFYDPAMGHWFCARCDGLGVTDPADFIHEGDCPYPNGWRVVQRERWAETLREAREG